jgi:hypothetical protein
LALIQLYFLQTVIVNSFRGKVLKRQEQATPQFQKVSVLRLTKLWLQVLEHMIIKLSFQVDQSTTFKANKNLIL